MQDLLTKDLPPQRPRAHSDCGVLYRSWWSYLVHGGLGFIEAGFIIPFLLALFWSCVVVVLLSWSYVIVTFYSYTAYHSFSPSDSSSYQNFIIDCQSKIKIYKVFRDKYNSYNYTLWGKTNVLYRIINSTWKGGFRCPPWLREIITAN